MSFEEAPSGIDDLIERLRSRVDERKAAGEYPDNLDERLEEHFRRIVFHRAVPEPDGLQELMDALDGRMGFGHHRMAVHSDLPGGALIHKTLNKALARQTQGILEQMQEFADGVRDVLRALTVAVHDPSNHTHADLVGHIDAAVERLSTYERAPVDSSAAVGDLRRRVEELERAEAARGFNPWFTNDAFEAAFRGSREHILASYYNLAELFGDYAPVLDFGCGRGEFLQLLSDMKIDAWGVEIDPVLAQAARADGHKVEAGDGLAILGAQDDGSLGGMVLLQVIEHLTIQQQLDLVRLAYDKLRPGGRMVVETVNPQSLYSFAHSFYLDPTHTRPVHPAYLTFLFQQAGFAEVRCDWRNLPPKDDRLELIDSKTVDSKATGTENQPTAETETETETEIGNRNVERLNQLLFAPADYALIVTR